MHSTGLSKGKIERVNRTVDQEFLSGLPFYTEGPRAADGRLYGPEAPPMALGLFVDPVRRMGDRLQHGAAALGAGWADSAATLDRGPTPVREVPEEQLRWLLLADAERTVNRDGIHFGGETFIAAELNGRARERVQVRYTPHDLRRIEIFHGDTRLCTARPQGRLSDEDRAASGGGGADPAVQRERVPGIRCPTRTARRRWPVMCWSRWASGRAV